MSPSASPDSKNLKKGVQNGLELKHRTGTQEGHWALLECQMAQIMSIARGLLHWEIWSFWFFRDKNVSQFEYPNLYK